jgi:hypothetical protein
MGMMKKPIQSRCRNSFITENFSPFPKRFIGGDNNTPMFISGIDQLKEQVCLLLIQAFIAHFIDYDKMRFSKPC